MTNERADAIDMYIDDQAKLREKFEALRKFVKDLAGEWNGKDPGCWIDIHDDLFGETPDDAFDRGMAHETQVRAYDAVALLQSLGEWKEDS